MHTLAAERAIKQLGEPYTLVLADPPYADSGALAVLQTLAGSPLACDDTIIVLEHSARDEPPGDLGRFCLGRVLRHGDSAVSIYCPPAGGPTGGEP